MVYRSIELIRPADPNAAIAVAAQAKTAQQGLTCSPVLEVQRLSRVSLKNRSPLVFLIEKSPSSWITWPKAKATRMRTRNAEPDIIVMEIANGAL